MIGCDAIIIQNIAFQCFPPILVFYLMGRTNEQEDIGIFPDASSGIEWISFIVRSECQCHCDCVGYLLAGVLFVRWILKHIAVHRGHGARFFGRHQASCSLYILFSLIGVGVPIWGWLLVCAFSYLFAIKLPSLNGSSLSQRRHIS